MKIPSLLTILLLFCCLSNSAMGQNIVQKESNLCLNAKNGKKTQCLDLKKSPIALEYIHGQFRMFSVPGNGVGTPPKGIFMSKRNTLIPVKSTISLEKNIFSLWDVNKKKLFELAFLPGTRGIFQWDKGGNIAFYSEDCLELEPIEVREGQVFYDGAEGASSLYFTLAERDDVQLKLICRQGIGISCLEDNIIDPRLFARGIDLEDAFGMPTPEELNEGVLTFPEGDGRLNLPAEEGNICKECEEVRESNWTKICEIHLSKRGIFKDCNGHILIVDLETGAVCLDVDLATTPLRIESVEGDVVQISLPESDIRDHQGCCPEK